MFAEFMRIKISFCVALKHYLHITSIFHSQNVTSNGFSSSFLAIVQFCKIYSRLEQGWIQSGGMRGMHPPPAYSNFLHVKNNDGV